MDYSVTFARHFSRLVWLLLHEPGNVDEQKAALRAITTISKDGPISFALQEWRLVVNGTRSDDSTIRVDVPLTIHVGNVSSLYLPSIIQ